MMAWDKTQKSWFKVTQSLKKNLSPRNRSWYLAAFISLALGGYSVPGLSWELITDDDKILVYKKDPGADGSISVRGEAVLDSSPEQVYTVLEDNELAEKWMPLVKKRKILQQIDENSRYEYTHIALPWPLQDRYFLDLSRIDRLKGGLLKISIKSTDKPKPEWKDDSKVLGFLHYSELVLTPQENGKKTHILIEINSDPRGAIPQWMVNLQQRQWPREFIEGLKDQLRKKNLLSH